MRTVRPLVIATSTLALLLTGMAAAPAEPSTDDTALAAAVSAGGEASCTLTSTGGVKCWGERFFRGTSYVFSTPGWVRGLRSGVRAIATGGSHSCALMTDGAVKCWGWNDLGQLGDGTTRSREEPVQVAGLTSGVVAITLDSDHSCALTNEGQVKCWGENHSGQLGDGTTRNRHEPVGVVGLGKRATSISTGLNSSCAVLVDGGVRCWGSNRQGALGDGTNTDHPTPVSVVGLPHGAIDVTVGANHACATTRHDEALCWGGNSHGQLGNGTTTSSRLPVQVVGLDAGRPTVSAGYGYTCAVTPSGPVKCWGVNRDGAIGDGTTVERPTPTPVLGLESGVLDLAVGANHSCVATTAGAARCWGENDGSQVGDGTYENERSVPMTVWGFSGTTTAIFRPDLMIARHRDGHYRGNDVYNSTGNGQTKEFTAHRGRQVTYFIRVQTDGDVGDFIYVEGHAWLQWQNAILEPRYFRGGEEISRSIELGQYWTRVGIDGKVTIRVTVRAHPNLVPRRGAAFTISSLSSHDPVKGDVVRIKAVRSSG
jgi:alpha-tubulin suppressor-like RCC1 family protein